MTFPTSTSAGTCSCIAQVACSLGQREGAFEQLHKCTLPDLLAAQWRWRAGPASDGVNGAWDPAPAQQRAVCCSQSDNGGYGFRCSMHVQTRPWIREDLGGNI